MYLFPVAGVHPRIYFPWQVPRQTGRQTLFFFVFLGLPEEEMVGDRETRQPGGMFERTTGSVQVKGSLCEIFCGEVRHGQNSSDVVSSLREENTWGADDTVTVVGKRKKCVPDGGSPVPTETVEHDEQTFLLDDWTHVEEGTVKYSLRRVKCPHNLVTCPVKCVRSFISTDRTPLPELIPVTVPPGNN